MNTVTAEIDITRPAGRTLVRELENKRYVLLKYPNPGDTGVWHDLDDVMERGFDKLSTHYGVDMRTLTSQYSKHYRK